LLILSSLCAPLALGVGGLCSESKRPLSTLHSLFSIALHSISNHDFGEKRDAFPHFSQAKCRKLPQVASSVACHPPSTLTDV
jgi:hypothetical protein